MIPLYNLARLSSNLSLMKFELERTASIVDPMFLRAVDLVNAIKITFFFFFFTTADLFLIISIIRLKL